MEKESIINKSNDIPTQCSDLPEINIREMGRRLLGLCIGLIPEKRKNTVLTELEIIFSQTI